MRISNPQGKTIKVTKDSMGQDEYEFRETFGQEEIVDLKTGKSNMSFYQPEKVFTTAGCNHDFRIEDMTKREFVCRKCTWGVTVGIQDINEVDGDIWIKIKEGKFKVGKD